MRKVTMVDRGGLHVWATIESDGSLLIQGQDLGGYPGASEYEYAVRAPSADVPTIRAALDAGDGDDLLSLLEAAGKAIVRRGERAWLTGLGITPGFWSRVEPADDPVPGPHAPRPVQPELAHDESGPLHEPDIQPEENPLGLADRFTLSRAWWIAGQLVRRHPALMVSRVVNTEQVPLLIVHDAPETTRVQFDLSAWIQYPTSGGLGRTTWSEVFAESDPLAVVRTIETDTRIGPPIDAADSPQSLVYRTIACALALGLDDAATWQAVHAHIDVHDPGASAWELFDTLPTGRALAVSLIDAALARAATSGEFVFHQPVWTLLRDLETVALLNVNGTVHTATGEVDLTATFKKTGGSISATTVALFGDYLP